MAEEFGEVYSGVLLREHWLVSLKSTPADAISRGIATRDVWLALCDDLQVPTERRYGRGLQDPQD